jgi:hypothetical protein
MVQGEIPGIKNTQDTTTTTPILHLPFNSKELMWQQDHRI